MKNIDKIVYLMLENRSFDSVLGWLYDKKNPSKFVNCGPTPVFMGLQDGNFGNPTPNGGRAPATKTPVSDGQKIPNIDPQEKFQFVTKQLYYEDMMGDVPNMLGFYADFLTRDPSKPDQIMQNFTPDSLPMLNFLAGKFAVSDYYFSSIPSQTDCNRAFSLTGNSIGDEFVSTKHKAFVNNVPLYEGTYRYYVEPTIWNVLVDNNISGTDDWMIYFSDLWKTSLHPYCFTQDLFWPNMGKQYDDHFKRIDEFMTNAQNGTLPKFSYLEPAWTILIDGIGLHGTDYHPPGNVAPGEHFMSNLYEALFDEGRNENTLLIINFDEHGGTYDHVPPPTNARAPWDNTADGTHYPGSSEHNFDFKRFGVRVPLILVSPYVDEAEVFRAQGATPLDHASVIATILEFFGLTDRTKWQMGSRVKNAPSFGAIVDRTSPRTMPRAPELQPIPPDVLGGENPFNDLQETIADRMLNHHAREEKWNKEQFEASHKKHFKDVKSVKELNEATNSVLADMEKPAAVEEESLTFWGRIVVFFRRLFGGKE